MIRTTTKQPIVDIDRAASRAEALAFVQPLALPGIALAVLYVAAVVMHHAGIPSQRFKFTEYGLLGLTLSIGLLGLAQIGRLSKSRQDMVTGAAACVAVIAAVEYSIFAADPFCWACAAIQFAFAVRCGTLGQFGKSARPLVGVVLFVLGLAAWTTAVHMPWWTDFVYLRRVSPYFTTVFLAAFALVCTVVYVDKPLTRPLSWMRFAPRLFDVGVVVFIALTSFRTAGLFDEKMAFHHWGVFVAPAEMVRQGGWLLWDVPSQYGFLSILTLAALPFHSVWTGLHLLVGVSQTAAAALLYWCLFSWLRHPLRRLLAALTSITAMFLMPCMGTIFGPQIMPSTTAFRFLWVYAIVGVLCLVYRARVRRRVDTAPLILGSVFWTLSVFWSYESAYWASAIWLPAYYLVLWQKTPRGFKALALVPPILIAIAFAIIEVVYLARLHHGPDWSDYGEYVRAFSNGFGQMEMNYQGAIWVPFLCCLIPASMALALFRKSSTDPAIPVLVGATAAVFAVSSYCIGRSHTNNVLNILPVCLFTTAIALRLGRRIVDQPSLSMMARTCLVPIFAVVISASIGIPVMMRGWLAGTLHPGSIAVEGRLPKMDAESTALLAAAHVGPGDSLAVYDINMPHSLDGGQSTYRHWSPITPAAAFTPLSQARAERYMRRFAQRTRRGGWLLVPKNPDFMGWDVSWIIPSLQKYYHATRMGKSPNYTLIYFEPR